MPGVGGEPEGDKQQLAYLQVLHFHPVCAFQEVEVLKAQLRVLFSLMCLYQEVEDLEVSNTSPTPTLSPFVCDSGVGGPEGEQHLADRPD